MCIKSPSLRVAAVTAPLSLVLLAACTGPLPERSTGPSGPAYDPATDPLVNPPTLTEPYPFDRPEVVARDDTLVRYMLGDPRTLNPIFAIFWEDYYLSGALFQSLTTRNADMTTVWNRTVVEEGAMADDWMSARVRVRPGLTWHDGKAWTMHDLKFTYDMVASDDVPAAMYKHDVDQIERIDVIDDLTVDFHFKDALGHEHAGDARAADSAPHLEQPGRTGERSDDAEQRVLQPLRPRGSHRLRPVPVRVLDADRPDRCRALGRVPGRGAHRALQGG